jgi:hypothetical protein
MNIFRSIWTWWVNRNRKLVTYYKQEIHWTDVDVHETITYFLYQTPSGRRSWEAHSYGYCKRHDMAEEYSTPMEIWVRTGEFPEAFLVKPGEDDEPVDPNLKVIPFKPKKGK